MRRLAFLLGIGAIVATLLAPAPTAAATLLPQPDSYAVRHDRVLTVAAPGVLANDIGLLGQSAALVSGPTHGALTLRSDGGFTYTSAAGFVGSDLFRYTPSGLLSLPTNVSLAVTNATPVANDDAYVATTGVQLSVAAPGVLQNDTDADGDALTAILVDGGGNGSFSLSSNGGFSFKSGGSFVGTHAFTYRVSDGITASTIATLSIDVQPPGATPTPTPTPTTPATPVPTPTPTLPLPSLPLPTLPLPTLSLPPILQTATPSVPPTPSPTPMSIVPGGPGATGSVGPSTPADPGGTSAPGESAPEASTPPGFSAGPGSSLPPGSAGGGPVGGGTVGGPAAGSNPGAGGADPSRNQQIAVGPDLPPRIGGLTDVDIVGIDGLVTWAVPSLALSVPGLLLVLAVGAQTLGATAWLPVVRRWLGGFGFGRRRRESRGTTA